MNAISDLAVIYILTSLFFGTWAAALAVALEWDI